MTTKSDDNTTGEQNDEEFVSETCRACGTQVFGVTAEEAERLIANHVLEEHGDEAPESVLEECRELVEDGMGE